MYCVRFKNSLCSVGYIRPWNSVRDGETYSLTYLIPSMIDGIKKELVCKGNIVRHKLRFNGMTSELFKSPMLESYEIDGKGKVKRYIKREAAVSTIHQLCCPEIILGFDNLDDAITASENTIYVGQTQYEVYPVSFYDNDDEDNIIVEMGDDEFSKLRGTETFVTDKEDENGIYCGNNRFRNNERMYIRIVRTK